LRLGIDLDGVCANWTKGAKEILNQRWSLDLNLYKESDTWDEVEDLVTPKQWKWLWTAGVERGLFARLDVFPGTVEALQHLSEKHDITLITHRPIKSAQDTFWWVGNRLRGIDFRGLHITKAKWDIPCDIYLDDKPENITALMEHRPTATHVIRTRQYNKHFEWPFRVDGWEQFVRFVEEREN
jgi:5'(3')-deoxyribonucleotidase